MRGHILSSQKLPVTKPAPRKEDECVCVCVYVYVYGKRGWGAGRFRSLRVFDAGLAFCGADVCVVHLYATQPSSNQYTALLH